MANGTGDTKYESFLKYINTGLLTLIFGFAMMIFVTVNGIKADNLEIQKELLRLKTVQDINTANIKGAEAKIDALEKYQTEAIKSWVDQNYVRRPQKID